MSRIDNSLGRRRRRCITLMEVLLTLALIGLLGGVVAINVRKAISEQRFLSDVSMVVNKLRLAQDLMLIYNTDLVVKFAKGAEGHQVWIEVEHQLNEAWKEDPPRKKWLKEITGKATLSSLSTVVLQPLKEGAANEVATPTLRFYSGGSVISQGILLLSDSATADTMTGRRRSICLPGFPHFIQSGSGADATDEACDAAKQADYNMRLSLFSAAEIRGILHNYEADDK